MGFCPDTDGNRFYRFALTVVNISEKVLRNKKAVGRYVA